MQTYTIISTVTLHSGILQLEAHQAIPRAAQLDDLGEGLYQIAAPVQFKAGEVIGFDGETNKALMQALKPAGKKGRK